MMKKSPEETNPLSEQPESPTLHSVQKIKNKKTFPVVGMGGSAGSLKAFEKFFTNMPADSGMAFIIILHLDPKPKGKIYEYFQRFTTMPVVEATDGTPVQPDHVYVIPPNKDMGIHNKKLLLLKPSESKGVRMPIDYFFQSLAEDQVNKAVGIIFSGMGSDGETGLKVLKEKLGMAMVQDPDTAEHRSMPVSAIGTNLVDYCLAPEDMPKRLIQYIKHPAISDDNSIALAEAEQSNILQKILMLLRSHTGNDFSNYKKSTITRRIDRRLAFHQLRGYTEYVNYVRENPQELDVLFNELLIGVTKFFRDKSAFEALKERIVPLFQDKDESETIRVWVAGCSTGEEAYSIAIIIMEFLETLKSGKVPKVQIFATDIDADAIDHARTGIYLPNIAADVSAQRLKKYFTADNDHYTIKKPLRDMIIFAQHNLIKDAPFTRVDLICCRNLLIYLNGDLQKKIVPVFHYSLNVNGILFIGPAETIGDYSEVFNQLDPKWKIFEKKEASTIAKKIIDFTFNISKQELTLNRDGLGKNGKKNSLVEQLNKTLLEKYSPASILINEKGVILYINGKIDKYLELPSGEAVMNIHRMATDDIKYAIGNAIHQVRANKNNITVKDLKIKEDGQLRVVNIQVNYLNDTNLQGLILIVFEDKGVFEKIDWSSDKQKEGKEDIKLEELEKELIYTRQQLHTTIEQMETSLEELKSTNEVLQTTNEELQSTNEESLTTKEEMQSLNEELMTINIQYQNKAEELTNLNNDMKNLLDSTQIVTIFLDNDLKILRYTPQVAKLFNLIPTDVGRPILDIVSNFEYQALEQDIIEVIQNLSSKQVEITTKQGEYYSLRIMPYRTLDNFINGAVLTFYKITEFKKTQLRLEIEQKCNEALIKFSSEALLVIDRNYKVHAYNKALTQLLHIESDISNKDMGTALPELWKQANLNLLFEGNKEVDNNLSFSYPLPGNKKLAINVEFNTVKDGKGNIILAVLLFKPANKK